MVESAAIHEWTQIIRARRKIAKRSPTDFLAWKSCEISRLGLLLHFDEPLYE